MLLRSFELPNLPFPASMLSICIACMLFTGCFEASNLPISACTLSIRIASMLFTCCFEASNHPIFHSRPVCYLYVLPVCYLYAASKFRTTQSSIPGQYAIYTYCQYAIYMLLRSFELPNLPFLASMLSIRIASVLFICCFEVSNYPIFHSWPVCYLYVLPMCYLYAASKLRTSQSSIPGQYAIYTYCQCAVYKLLRSFELPNLPFLASMLSIRIASVLFISCFEVSNYPIFHSRPVCYLYVLPVCYLYAASKFRTTQSSIPGQYAIYMYCLYAIYWLLRSFEPPNLGLYAIYTYCQYVIYMLLRSFEPSNLPFPASMLSIRIASVLFICCFEVSNYPIFHSWPVCYLYVLPVCYLYAASKFRTTQSSIPGQYAIYTYCQCAIYMLLRSFEPPNLPFLASMLSIRIASVLFICCFEASNHPIFHSWPVCYLYVLPVCYLYAASKFRTTQSSIPGQYAIYTYCQCAIYMLLRSFELPNLPFLASMLSIRIASMLFICCFEVSNLPIFHSRPLPVCYLHAASKLRTTQSSIPGQYAIYMYCLYAIYWLLRSFEPPNLGLYAIYTYCQYVIYMLLRSFEPSFPASMLSIRIASVLFICCFEASNYPIFHSWPVCYLYVLPMCYLYAASKLRTTQSSIPGQYAIYTYCQCAIYMLLRSFELPNLPFLASMLSIRIASVLFICCFEVSNYPIFHSWPVCYLYVLPVCYLYAASKLRTTQSSIPGQYAIYTYCQYAIYMLLRSFKPPNLPFRPVCYLHVWSVCYFHAVYSNRCRDIH